MNVGVAERAGNDDNMKKTETKKTRSAPRPGRAQGSERSRPLDFFLPEGTARSRTRFVPRAVFRSAFTGVVPVCVATWAAEGCMTGGIAVACACFGGLTSPDADVTAVDSGADGGAERDAPDDWFGDSGINAGGTNDAPEWSNG